MLDSLVVGMSLLSVLFIIMGIAYLSHKEYNDGIGQFACALFCLAIAGSYVIMMTQ